MPAITWDKVGDRVFESGLDRGVLYLPGGSAVPWNGLLEVVEKSDSDATPVYFDGMKISELVTLGAFLGKIKAITYPDEFIELEGMAKVVDGLYFGGQKPKSFGLSYRTRVGNDVEGEDAYYKLHLLYNVTAVVDDKTYASASDDPDIIDFEWDISALPEEVEGYRPTAHVIIDSRYVDEDSMTQIEDALYGTLDTSPSLIPLSDFTNFFYFGYRYKIIDNGDGTWTAISPIEGLIEFDPVDPTLFTLNDANATYLAPDLYEISDSFL